MFVAVFSGSTRSDDPASAHSPDRSGSAANPVNGVLNSAWPLWRTSIARAAPELFPPEIVQVKALACELPARQGVPLSRWSHRDLARQVLSIRPGGFHQRYRLALAPSGRHPALADRCWLFPRDRDGQPPAGSLPRSLGGSLEFVVSADESHATPLASPGFAPKKHETVASSAGTGISRKLSPDRLVKQVMNQKAHRVFWIVAAVIAVPLHHACSYPNLRLGPIHASWPIKSLHRPTPRSSLPAWRFDCSPGITFPVHVSRPNIRRNTYEPVYLVPLITLFSFVSSGGPWISLFLLSFFVCFRLFGSLRVKQRIFMACNKGSAKPPWPGARRRPLGSGRAFPWENH